jgi:Spy/CpxP family protein refolding chaperone
MKKIIAAALTLVALTTGATFAQGVYSRPYNNRPQYGGPRYDRDRDQYQDELKIDRIDAIVGLNRRQEKQLHKIEDNYDRLFATSRMTPDGYRQLQLRKRQDMLAVLTSAQRDRLFAQQQYSPLPAPFGRRG